MTRASLVPSFACALALAAGQARAQCDLGQFINGADPAANDQNGSSVAMNGQYVFMGAPNKTTAAGLHTGEVYGYVPFSNIWGQSDHLIPSDIAPNDRFGSSIGLGANHTRAVIGAPGFNSGRGCAYIYTFNPQTIQWAQGVKLTEPGLASGDGMGSSAAMNTEGDIVALGAPYQDVTSPSGSTNHAGVVHVWSRNAQGTWVWDNTLFQTFSGSRHDNDNYGYALAADGSVVVAGVPNGDAFDATDCGYIDIWRKSGNTWFSDAEIFANDRQDADAYGSAVAISGNAVAIGAPNATVNGNTHAGAVYLQRYVNGSWVNDGKITASDPVSQSFFGNSVSLSGDTLVVGAFGTAHAYVFRRVGNQQWVQDARMTYEQPFEEFASAVAVSGSQFVVGAPLYDTPNFANSGGGYVFNVPTGPSDSCAGAFQVGQGQFHGCTVNATVDGASNCGTGSPVGPDVWYRYTSTQSGTLTIDTQGSQLDTILSIHSGCPGTAADTIICNDDAGFPSQLWSSVTFPVSAGSSYLIRVAGYNNSSGAYTLNIGPVAVCYANCDLSTAPPVLNVNDFICFQNRFAAGNTWANCDGSTTPPVLNVNDFICFQARFASGCP